MAKADNHIHITQRTVAGLETDPEHDRVFYDDELPGFGVRVTKAGIKSFIQNYYANLQERRLTIGPCNEMAAELARRKATKIRDDARNGIDPQRDREIVRGEKTVADLSNLYLEQHAEKKKSRKSVYEDKRMLKAIILPKLGKLRISAVGTADLERIHNSLSTTPYQANRVLALLSKMFSFAMKWKLRTDNPAKGIERFHEDKRDTWFDIDQLHAISDALDSYPEQDAADAIRLLVVTGARPHEVIGAEWSQFNLRRGVWTKPSHHTKERKIEHVSLSENARFILQRMWESKTGPYLFPGRNPGTARTTLTKAWRQVCKDAGLAKECTVVGKRGKLLKRWKPTVRVYDLRHTFASHLVSSGVSLPLIGELMGHTQPKTTARYAHVADSAQRDAANQFPKVLEMKKRAS